MSAVEGSRLSTAEAQARQIQMAFNTYFDDHSQYPAAPTEAGAVAAHSHFFGEAGVFADQTKVPTELLQAMFIMTAYQARTGPDQTQPAYEMVVEVKNVRTADRDVHITKEGVTRDSTSTADLSDADEIWPPSE